MTVTGPALTVGQPPWTAWPRNLWRALLILWLLFWLLMIFVAVQDNWDDDSILWWQPLLWEGSSAVVGTAMTALMLRYGSRLQHLLATPWHWFWQHLKWLPLASLVFIVCAFGLRHAVYAAAGLSYHHPPWPTVYVYETLKLALFLGLWLGVVFGVHSFLAWREQQTRLHAMQQALTEAKLQQLKAQLQPHFLFNTLNTISSFMHSDVERADRLLIRLADLLRASLTLGEQNTILLRDELQLAKLYAEIMTERFGPRVALEWDISDDCLALSVPALLLQPLLENAFKHAVEQSREPIALHVSANRDGEMLQLQVSNSLPSTQGGSSGQSHNQHHHQNKNGTGIGLRNCRERLQALYGERASLQIEHTANAHRVHIRLPVSP
ncbi:histidine kinase [Permianibacter sp. IMCC34836]|uniref:sensor histidine kinase n=1 Tax=Permianibacter fluminis TaxID=2738515 RepID=UPI001556E0C7|nr:histidine kinase [Permianibacter fluminis]NQD39096.1 histidine kinase [Permianibacter fluminis]